MKLYLYKCNDNRTWQGSVARYFDNMSEAKKFGNLDYCSYCGKIYFEHDFNDRPINVYHFANDVDDYDFEVYAWGLFNGKLWKFGEECPKQ